LESDKDSVRLVATDGRRLVVARLDRYEARFRGQIIIPTRVAKLVEKLPARESIPHWSWPPDGTRPTKARSCPRASV
jgi:hypothetical protein